MNFLHNCRQFSFVNVCFCPVKTHFFLQFQQFGLQFILLVFLFLEFGVEFFSEEFEGLVLLLEEDGFAVDVFHEDLFVVKQFEFLEFVFEPNEFGSFSVKFVLGFFSGASFLNFFEFELLEFLLKLKFFLDGELEGDLDFFFESFVLFDQVLDVDFVLLKF